MWPKQVRPTHIHNVALRVSDLERSTRFYCEIFGLEVREAVPPGGNVRICAAPSESKQPAFGITLIHGLPRGSDPIGMDHVSLQVSCAEDVESIYVAAVARGAHATEPRAYGGYYQIFLFDPDGYKIEVASSDLPGKPLDGYRTRSKLVARMTPDNLQSSNRTNAAFGGDGRGVA